MNGPLRMATRITPAYAGTCGLGKRNPVILEDHPRIRGDMCPVARLNRGRPGSPPHTRGHAGWTQNMNRKSRITPAYAGTCLIHSSLILLRWDHPRIRGDMSKNCARKSMLGGSPPHTRGHVQRQRFIRAVGGITPAYAGTWYTIRKVFTPEGDHPRIRGDMLSDTIIKKRPGGSPPHTRGHAFMFLMSLRPTRITPAYAGTCHGADQ